jgi:hypothetical protein
MVYAKYLLSSWSMEFCYTQADATRLTKLKQTKKTQSFPTMMTMTTRETTGPKHQPSNKFL